MESNLSTPSGPCLVLTRMPWFTFLPPISVGSTGLSFADCPSTFTTSGLMEASILVWNLASFRTGEAVVVNWLVAAVVEVVVDVTVVVDVVAVVVDVTVCGLMSTSSLYHRMRGSCTSSWLSPRDFWLLGTCRRLGQVMKHLSVRESPANTTWSQPGSSWSSPSCESPGPPRLLESLDDDPATRGVFSEQF